MFDGKLEPKSCMEWLEALGKKFEKEEIPTNQRVKLEKSKLKGPTLSRWNFFQNERVEEDKKPTSTWNRMMSEIMKQFVLEDYEVMLHKRLHNLKKKDMDVSSYSRISYFDS